MPGFFGDYRLPDRQDGARGESRRGTALYALRRTECAAMAIRNRAGRAYRVLAGAPSGAIQHRHVTGAIASEDALLHARRGAYRAIRNATLRTASSRGSSTGLVNGPARVIVPTGPDGGGSSMSSTLTVPEAT